MNWNNYDTKYIIKRLIIGFGMLILFSILTANKAHALTDVTGDYLSTNVTYHDGPGHVLKSWRYNTNSFAGYKDGKVYFNMTITGKFELYNVTITSENKGWPCHTGTTTSYKDNNNQVIFISAECPLDFNRGNKLDYVNVEGYAGGSDYYYINFPINFSYYSYDTPKSTIQAIQDASATTAVNNLNNQLQNAASQAHTDSQNVQAAINSQTQQQHADSQAINNSINNDNITSTDADDLTNNQAFTDSTGLQAVIELPLNMINSLTNTCQPINITIPWLDYTGTIPCMSTIYRSKFNSLYQVVKLIINGFLVYRLLLKVYELVHEAKQPDEDKLEVIDL